MSGKNWNTLVSSSYPSSTYAYPGSGNAVSINIFTPVKNWLKNELGQGGTDPKYGIFLKLDPNTTTARSFKSSRASSGTPTISITYNEEGISDTAVTNGVYYIRNKKSKLYLDVHEAGTAQGTYIRQYKFNGNQNQRWKLVLAETGVYRLYPQHVSNMAMDMVYNSSNGRYEAKLWVTTGTNSKITLQKNNSNGNSSYSFKFNSAPTAVKGYAAAVLNASTAEGSNIILAAYNSNNTNDDWELVNVNTAVLGTTTKEYYMKNVNSGKFLQLQNAGTSDGTLIDVNKFGHLSQQWEFSHVTGEGSTYRIKSARLSISKRIDGDQGAGGNNIRLWTPSDTLSQQKWNVMKVFNDSNETPTIRLRNMRNPVNVAYVNGTNNGSLFKIGYHDPYNSRVNVWGDDMFTLAQVNWFTSSGVANRTFSIELEGYNAKGSVWSPIIEKAYKSWNTSKAATNISIANSSPHKLTVEYGALMWDGWMEKLTVNDNTLLSSRIHIFLNGFADLETANDTLRQAIVAHEMGHYFWLKDNPPDTTKKSLMNYDNVIDLGVVTPQEFDENNVKFVYD